MIRRGLLLWLLTVLCGALAVSLVWLGDAIVTEFQEKEAVETMTVSDISTFDPNDAGGIYLQFRYRSTLDGKDYSSAWLYTADRSCQVGDTIETVTRDGRPVQILSRTPRGRQRTSLERALDASLGSGALPWLVTALLLTAGTWLLGRRWIAAELKSRKAFACAASVLYAGVTVFAAFYMVMANHESGWEGLGDFFTAVLLAAGAALLLLIAWLADSIRRKRKEKQKA